MTSTINTKTKNYDISNHWFNKLDQRFLRPYFGPVYREFLLNWGKNENWLVCRNLIIKITAKL